MTSEFDLTHQALDAAETMLRCLPQVSTNAKGTKPNMTTTEALKLVRAALAQDSVADPVRVACHPILSAEALESAQMVADFETNTATGQNDGDKPITGLLLEFYMNVTKALDQGTSPATEGDA